ncbi:hypothetical protein NAEGRDRAFT_69307 [Naegleria gruberi]|uniref:FAD-binding PCMH-type domain-containing protein n=1 Tax=Naegleria gruberi TaxID=5762 RepID=D2VK87_NAEGR|nr:uncharacterized protein NAEGRDRAFT_69307 [Naegleria gruberi]EFC42905.1 hypothetical protein NAEGRDRAFT_69307 [Naegleria gruberi]|eukprot:XP_002675649.1 hypothetical protein NAEGRDRAFT_69307 [Naegleria gruberi strain NEG-M]
MSTTFQRLFHSNNIALTLDRKHVDEIKRIFDEDTSTTKKGGEVLYNPNEIDMAFNHDWTGQFKGASELVLRPRTTEQVSKIVKYCNENNIVIIPQGGNTGLVGGGIPVNEQIEHRPQIILSTNLMNEIISFNDKSGKLICQSGCILEHLNHTLEEKGYQMPLDLAAKGSCQIGGNIATGAGGIRYVKFGSLHSNLLGLECVLPDGSIMDSIKEIRKDNTGYHLSHLFVGSEGTLGIITKVALQVPIKPKSVNVALISVESFEKVQELILMAKRELGEILSAVEFVDSDSMKLVMRLNHETLQPPVEGEHPFYLVIETQGSSKEHDEEKLNDFFAKALEEGVATDGSLAFDEKQSQYLWKFRELVSESLKKDGYVYKYDISIPLAKMYDIVLDMKERMKVFPQAKVYSFGHLGDENLHLNIVSPKFEKQIKETIEPYVYEWTSKHRGSISAEHGIGVLKKNYLHYSQTNVALNLMKSIKKTLDPNNIMNPHKVL